ncbi:hypothetical protein Z517_07471 [Fonsecaea pedrosoi CBS 271.37]|uniref:Transcription factor domain-containing protein n=1 Tax=Fonsecaea pedrosoi CBS 271.37 TaxID=1442368 RepID=A0A0D2GYZ6_9EURO|nr:uncharacterized protein Z517_07471 [Fonsecaea pedrosoi CBS 271.37]KIW77639.1 hypothetical protein Z517_07471 [Fonsecaea pedrosoi CBS 271.37]
MGSFEPVAGSREEATTTPSSRGSHGHRQIPSYDQQMASQTLATFPLRNTSDAIRLLDQDRASFGSEQSDNVDVLGVGASRPQFFLLREGFIDESTLFRLFNFYLGSLHPMMPLIPYERRPTTSEQILTMAAREPHFVAAILVVTTGLLGEYTLHHHLWQRVERLFAQVAIMGTNESLEMIEGLLLLSGTTTLVPKSISARAMLKYCAEYPPNMGHSKGLGFEDRMCWMTVGTVSQGTPSSRFPILASSLIKAVRLGYLRGLEQLVMQPDDIEEKFADDRGRGKIVWTCKAILRPTMSARPANQSHNLQIAIVSIDKYQFVLENHFGIEVRQSPLGTPPLSRTYRKLCEDIFC